MAFKRRHKVSRKKSKSSFRKGTKIHKRNSATPMRGGFRI